MSKQVDLIPNYIEASSPSGLRSLMLKTNLKDGACNQYFNISNYANKSGKVRWIAWYFTHISNKELLQGLEGE